MKAFTLVFFCLFGVAASAQSIIPPEYGRPVSYLGRVLDYPEFSIRFVKREEHRNGAVSYAYEILDTEKKTIGGFSFVMSGYYDPVRIFTVGGKTFAAEMFYSTVGEPVPRVTPPKKNGSLPHDQIVIWDKSAAKAMNPVLVETWLQKEANQRPERNAGAASPSISGSIPGVAHP